MKKKDHLALGRYLLKQMDSNGLQKHKFAFLLGCVEPDYNALTYLRGIKGHQKFRGHNAENSFAHVAKCMSKLQKKGLSSAWDYFTLGTMLHYIADAFTWPHNEFWDMSMRQHIAYEIQLHKCFSNELEAADFFDESRTIPSLLNYFSNSHEAYRAATRKIKTDCQYVINVCQAMLSGSLRFATETIKENLFLKGVDTYENSYNHGLV